MKPLFTLLILSTLNFCLFSQSTQNCDTSILGATCAINKNQPEDGNGTLGMSYSNTACGLNYVQASVMTTQRYINPGTGYPATLTISGIPPSATVEKAFLWWAGNGTANNPNFIFDGNPLVGTLIGTSGSKCWIPGTETYRADLTNEVIGNGSYTFSSPLGDDMDGVTLMVIYTNPMASYQGTIQINDGAMSSLISINPLSQTMTGLSVSANTTAGNAFLIVSDMQDNLGFPGHNATLNGTTGFFSNDFWNFNLVNTTYTQGQTTAPFTISPLGGDCYLWLMMGVYYQISGCIACATPSTSLVASTSFTGDTCSNTCDKTATVNVTGGTAPFTYSWNTIPEQTTQTATNLCPGTYIVTVYDANCEFVKDTIVFKNPPPKPVINAVGPFCINDAAINLTASTLGGVWKGMGITDTINGTFDPATAGAGTHQIIKNDTGFCIFKDTTLITVNPMPTLAVSNLTFCNGANVSASNFVSNPLGATYSWTNTNTAIGLAASGTGNTPAFSATNTTSAPIVANISVVPSVNGCAGNSVSFTITVNPTAIVIGLNNLTFCSGETVPLLNFSSATLGTTYTWTNSNSAIGLPSAGTGVISPFTITNIGTMVATAIITVIPSANGCVGFPETFTLTVYPDYLEAGPDSLICLGDSISLNAVGSGLGTINWYEKPDTSTIVGSGTPFYPNITDTGTHVFYVKEVGGCATNIDSVKVKANAVNAFIYATPTKGLIPLNVFFGNGSTTGSGINYSWNFGTGDLSAIFQPTYTYYDQDTYTAMLVVTDGFCFDTAYVTIAPRHKSTITVPNVFTPNQDGSNDLFKWLGVNLKTVEVEIYNRWGQKLYASKELNQFWDGKTPHGHLAPEGTYFYSIKAIGEDDDRFTLKGAFSLMR